MFSVGATSTQETHPALSWTRPVSVFLFLQQLSPPGRESIRVPQLVSICDTATAACRDKPIFVQIRGRGRGA